MYSARTHPRCIYYRMHASTCHPLAFDLHPVINIIILPIIVLHCCIYERTISASISLSPLLELKISILSYVSKHMSLSLRRLIKFNHFILLNNKFINRTYIVRTNSLRYASMKDSVRPLYMKTSIEHLA